MTNTTNTTPADPHLKRWTWQFPDGEIISGLGRTWSEAFNTIERTDKVGTQLRVLERAVRQWDREWDHNPHAATN